jgi:hypothetical protein
VAYWELVTRSFAITWRHRYLWLLALFAGEGGGGASVNYSSPVQSNRSPGSLPNFASFPQQAAAWLSHNFGVVVMASVLIVVLGIAFFVLAAVCEGALVRASAEHDAERPFGLGRAWQSGVATMGTIIRFRLLLIALGLPVFIVLLGLVAGLVLAILSHSTGLAVALGLLALFVFLAAIVYAIYLSFLDRLGMRAVVLELLRARAALVRGHRLLVKRLGRVLLVWLLSIVTAIVVGIGATIVLAILVVPAVFAGAAAYTAGSPWLGLVIAFAVLILLPVVLVVEGFLAAQMSTYWTVAFRRLELDQPPPSGYLYQATPPAAPTG